MRLSLQRWWCWVEASCEYHGTKCFERPEGVLINVARGLSSMEPIVSEPLDMRFLGQIGGHARPRFPA